MDLSKERDVSINTFFLRNVNISFEHYSHYDIVRWVGVTFVKHTGFVMVGILKVIELFSACPTSVSVNTF